MYAFMTNIKIYNKPDTVNENDSDTQLKNVHCSITAGTIGGVLSKINSNEMLSLIVFKFLI